MVILEPIEKLTKDLKEAGRKLSNQEARFLVDAYYMMQENRKRSDNQVRALTESGEPNEILAWLAKQSDTLENQIKFALDRFSDASPVGRWARLQVGIGPIIASGLLAHIDIEKANTAGKIWRFAGLDPTDKWNKGEKRPWNASLKTLCWKIGESFTKVSGRENAFYGKIYAERKKLETAKNEAGDYAAQAAEILRTKNISKTTETYKHLMAGHLSPDHIFSRAKRYSVKFFLSHYHHVAYVDHYKTLPPAPFVIAHLGHIDYIPPPGITE